MNKTIKKLEEPHESLFNPNDAHIEGELGDSIKLFAPSWDALKSNFMTFLIEVVVSGVVLSVALLASLKIGAGGHLQLNINPNSVALLSAGAGLAILHIPALGFTRLISAKGYTITYFQALQASFQYFWRYLGVVVLTYVLIGLGFILFIAPGLFLLKRWALAPYYLIDKDCGVFEAMRLSAKTPEKYNKTLWGVIGIKALIGIVSAIPVLGTIVVIVPKVMYYCAFSAAYVEIQALDSGSKS